MPLLIFLNSCFFVLFWLDVSFFLLVHTVDLSPSFLPFTVGSLLFFLISLCIAFIFSSNLQPYSTISVSILITSVLNSASDRLAISSLLNSFSGVLMFFHLGCVSLSQCACYVVRGRALGIGQGEETHFSALNVGEGLRRNNATCSAVIPLSVTSPATHKGVAPFWC